MENVYTSYFAKVMKIDTSDYLLVSITRAGRPSWFDKPAIWRKDLAPSWNLLNDWKEGLITWKEYEERYKAEMMLPTRAQAIRESLRTNMIAHDNKPMILLCYEKTQCHRFILGRYIQAEGLQ